MNVIGWGTAVNVGTVLAGSGLGLLLGNRLSDSTRTAITQVLGLCTFVMAGLTVVPLTREPLASAIPGGAVFVVVILALVLGTLVGAAVRLEERTEQFAAWLRHLFVRSDSPGSRPRARFVNGFMTATLLYCIGPMAILGPLQEGLGQGAQLVLVKAVLDGIASIAFASSLGVGVLASALAVGIYQGCWTLVGVIAGDILSPVEIDVVSVTGGVILLGLGLRLVGVAEVKVADMVPALLVAPLLLGLGQLLF